MWDPQISVFNAIKLLEILREMHRISTDPEFDIDVFNLYRIAGASSNWPLVWGYDSPSCEMWEDSLGSATGLSADGGNSWYASCGSGYHATWLAPLLYHDIGEWGLDYSLSVDYDTAEVIHWNAVIEGSDTLFKARTWNLWFGYNVPGGLSSMEGLDSSFTKVTIDPYVHSDGRITTIIVNRDTTDADIQPIYCHFTEVIPMDSIKAYCITIDTTIWQEACEAIFEDPNFLPFAFAHNGFNYDSSGVKLRYKPVAIETLEVSVTDSSTYFAIGLESMTFARVDAYPKQDSIEIVLYPGWNLVSIPMYTGDKVLERLFYENEDTTDMRDSSLYIGLPGTMDSILISSVMRTHPDSYYPYSGSTIYLPHDCRDSVNTPGHSYWVHSETTETVIIKGVPCGGFGVDIYSGWNMTGSVWDTLDFFWNTESGLFDSMDVLYWSTADSNYRDTTCIISTWGYFSHSAANGYYQYPTSNIDCESGSRMAIKHKNIYSLVSPPGYVDTSSIACSISNDTIFVTNRDNQNIISGCMVLIETDDTTVIGYTDAQNGEFTDDLIDVNDSTYIFLYKPGYRKLLVYPYGAMDSDTFQSDIVIYGDITVDSNDTLVILPGTNIYAAYRSDMMQTWMAERIDIVVQGHIIAVGDSLAPITFTVDVPADSTPAPNDWKGIVHHFSGSGEYEHCRFEFMRYLHGHQPGGDVTFKNCTFAKPLYNAISYGTSRPSYIDPPKLIFEDCQFDTIGSWNSIVLHGTRDSTRITNCVFDSAASYVIEVKDSGKAIIEACSLNSCYGILAIHDYSSVTMSDCDLNTGGSWFGFNVYDAGTLNIDNSLIARSSSGTGPRIYNACSAEFRYCSITDFTSDGISCESATADMGTDKDLGHNCVWSDHSSANRLYFATKTADEFSVFGNWIDTLIFGGPSASEIDTGSFFPPDSCDTSIAKIVIEPEDKSSVLPEEFELGPARPNPFNSTVTFDYKVPVECDIEIAIFDILGNKIRILFDGTRGSGLHSEVWDGKDDKGRTVASGTYLYRLKADDYEETRKMTFLK